MAQARQIHSLQEFMEYRQLLPHRQMYRTFLKLVAIFTANVLAVVAMVLALISS